jgi:hypothetical protein
VKQALLDGLGAMSSSIGLGGGALNGTGGVSSGLAAWAAGASSAPSKANILKANLRCRIMISPAIVCVFSRAIVASGSS